MAADQIEYGKAISSHTIASPSIKHDRTDNERTAPAISENRLAKLLPFRVKRREVEPSRRARMRKPSCLIS